MGRGRNAIILGLALIAGAARAASNEGFQGRWVIAEAKPAPWADRLLKGGDEERKRLLGQTIVIGRDFVTGPRGFGCRHATFTSHDDPPDYLFEGGLAEGPNGQTRDARSAARALGITAAKVPTLETSCSEIAYHRTSPTTLMFGLNNLIYILHPAP
jgi:hypothetical protein